MSVTYSLILRFALDIARGVQYLHRRNLIQRDLKARNILIDANLVAKISDFGLSRVMDDETAKMTACGTPAWTAPEVVRMQPYTHKADIYSLGVLLYELIARQEPFNGQKGVQIAYAAAEQGLRPSIPSFCPADYAQLMRACWQDMPDLRPSLSVIIKRLFAMKKAVDAAQAAPGRALAAGGAESLGEPAGGPGMLPLPLYDSDDDSGGSDDSAVCVVRPYAGAGGGGGGSATIDSPVPVPAARRRSSDLGHAATPPADRRGNTATSRTRSRVSTTAAGDGPVSILKSSDRGAADTPGGYPAAAPSPSPSPSRRGRGDSAAYTSHAPQLAVHAFSASHGDVTAAADAPVTSGRRSGAATPKRQVSASSRAAAEFGWDGRGKGEDHVVISLPGQLGS